MIVYGDRERQIDPRQALAEIEGLLRARRQTEALIAAGVLAQGLADHAFGAAGADDLAAAPAAALEFVTAIARALYASGPEPTATHLAALPLPHRVRGRTPEGFAFYAVHPRAYAEAAAAHAWGGPPLVIGLRSIGVTLAAVVAAVTGGEAISLRPTGHPFDRRLAISDRLRRRIAEHPGPYAVVDEGPGLSGSSFGCVGDLLDDLGVAPERVVFMPSHRGSPGPEAAPRHADRWARARRLVRTLDDGLAERPIEARFEADIGTVQAVHDHSAGAWRAAWPLPQWPPAAPAQERRKFRLQAGSGAYIARFAGLDRSGAEKLERARALHGAGFGPEPVAFREGFLLERWVHGPAEAPSHDLTRLGAYLRFRAESFPARPEDGADDGQLLEMARVNAEAICGAEAARRVAAVVGRSDDARRPVFVDGRLHPWEWRAVPGGGFRKLDAIDHACGHDLIGAQDVGWDLAGAIVELGLDEAQGLALAGFAGADPAGLPRFRAAYAAFQLGLWGLAANGAPPAEADRIRRWTKRYVSELERTAAP